MGTLYDFVSGPEAVEGIFKITGSFLDLLPEILSINELIRGYKDSLKSISEIRKSRASFIGRGKSWK